MDRTLPFLRPPVQVLPFFLPPAYRANALFIPRVRELFQEARRGG